MKNKTTLLRKLISGECIFVDSFIDDPDSYCKPDNNEIIYKGSIDVPNLESGWLNSSIYKMSIFGNQYKDYSDNAIHSDYKDTMMDSLKTACCEKCKFINVYKIKI